MGYYELEQDKAIKNFLKNNKNPSKEDLFNLFYKNFLHPDLETEFIHKVTKNVIGISYDYYLKLSTRKKFHFLRALGKLFDTALSMKIWEFQLSRDDALWYWKGIPTYFVVLFHLTESLEILRQEIGIVDRNRLYSKIVCVEGKTEYNFIKTLYLTTRALNFDFPVYNYQGKGEIKNLIHFIKEKNRQGIRVLISYDKDRQSDSFSEKIKKKCEVGKFFGFKKYFEGGIESLRKISRKPGRIWNKLLDEEIELVIKVAKEHPELSPRLISVKITDKEGFYISEKTVYRILKERNLISPRPLSEIPASKEWHRKTTKPDEIWQCDATHMFVAGWGFYKLIPVQDDFSRKVLSKELKADETSYSISDAIEVAREEAKKCGHKLESEPILLTDHGAGFVGEVLEEYLKIHGMPHVFGQPYHPQTRGKIERFNRTIKEKTVYLIAYCSPDELQKAINNAVDEYNDRPHEGLQNVSPNDVYAGRKEEILAKRARLKELTLAKRKMYNLGKEVRECTP